MRLYETTFVLNPQADEASLDNQVKAIGSIITGNGGKIVAEDRMGTRRLAYEINGMMQGYYSSFLFEAEPQVLPMLERHYKLEDPYVRHLTILFEGDPETIRERQQAMATAMEANERARRHAHAERRGDRDHHRRDESPRRPSDRDRDRDRDRGPARRESGPENVKAPETSSPAVEAAPSAAPVKSDAPIKSAAPVAPVAPEPVKAPEPPTPSNEDNEL